MEINAYMVNHLWLIFFPSNFITIHQAALKTFCLHLKIIEENGKHVIKVDKFSEGHILFNLIKDEEFDNIKYSCGKFIL